MPNVINSLYDSPSLFSPLDENTQLRSPEAPLDVAERRAQCGFRVLSSLARERLFVLEASCALKGVIFWSQATRKPLINLNINRNTVGTF